MRLLWVALVVVLLASASFAGLVIVRGSEPAGFGASALRVPTASVTALSSSSPGNMTAVAPLGDYGSLTVKWAVTETVFSDYGGALNLSVTEDGARVFVYGFGIQWSTGQSFFRECSVLVNSSETKDLGVLVFGAPTMPTTVQYHLEVRLDAYNPAVDAWYDYGTVTMGQAQSVTLTPLASPENYTVTSNPTGDFNKMNSLVDVDRVGFVVDEIHNKYPGNFSIDQIAEAYSWVKENIAYQLENPIDYWPTVGEVLDRGYADCKGQSILMASIVTALGGSVRENLIEGHAFPTVYVAPNATSFAEVRAAIASYYGLSGPTLHLAYFVDPYGYWLVIDPDGVPYCGGIPAQSTPLQSNEDLFQIQSSYLEEIDITGQPAKGLFDF